MTVYVKNSLGINVPLDSADTTTTTANTTQNAAATTQAATQPQIGSWTTIDRSIPATFNWDPFNYRTGTNYSDVLKAMYGNYAMQGPGTTPTTSFESLLNQNRTPDVIGSMVYKNPLSQIGTGGFGMGASGPGTSWEYAKFYDDPKKKNQTRQNQYGENVAPIAFDDDNFNRALDEVNKALQQKLYTTAFGFGAGTTGNTSLNTRYIDKNVMRKDEKGRLKRPNIGVSGISLIDAYGGKDEDKIIDKVAAKYGLSNQQIREASSNMQRALNTYYDPVGSNWQEVKATPWAAEIDPAVKSYATKAGEKLFEQLAGKLPADSPLGAAYYVMHSQPELRGAKQVGPQFKYTDWTDFLPTGVSVTSATEQQFKDALAAYDAQNKLMQPWKDPSRYSAKSMEKDPGGSYFDLFKSEKLDIPKGYNYVGSNALHNYNVLVNAGIDPKELGIDVNKVYKSALEKEATGGFLGSFGPLASLASFIPGPVGTIASIISGLNSLQSGDVVSGLASFAGGTGLTSAIAGNLKSTILSNFPDEITSLATKFNMKPAELTDMLVRTGISAGIGGANAIENGGSFLSGVLASGGTELLGRTINASLVDKITDPKLRDFISTQSAQALARVATGGPVLPNYLGSGTQGGSQGGQTGTQTGGQTGAQTTTPAPKDGETKMVGGTEYKYQNGIWTIA